MARDKKSFLLYTDLISVVEELSDEEAGLLLKHTLMYVNDMNPTPPNRLIKLIFEPIKLQLKRDLREWNQIRSKRSESGKLGGLQSGMSRTAKDETKQNEANEANASKLKQNEANASKTKQTQANEAVTVSVSVNGIVTDNVKNNENKKEEEGEKSQKRFSPPTISELSEYITQERFSVNPETFFNFYESNGWFVGKTKMKDWRAAVRTWNSKEKQNKKSVHPAVEDISNKHYEKW